MKHFRTPEVITLLFCFVVAGCSALHEPDTDAEERHADATPWIADSAPDKADAADVDEEHDASAAASGDTSTVTCRNNDPDCSPTSCPDENDPSVRYLSHRPNSCTILESGCEPNEQTIDGPCGCVCITPN